MHLCLSNDLPAYASQGKSEGSKQPHLPGSSPRLGMQRSPVALMETKESEFLAHAPDVLSFSFLISLNFSSRAQNSLLVPPERQLCLGLPVVSSQRLWLPEDTGLKSGQGWCCATPSPHPPSCFAVWCRDAFSPCFVLFSFFPLFFSHFFLSIGCLD